MNAFGEKRKSMWASSMGTILTFLNNTLNFLNILQVPRTIQTRQDGETGKGTSALTA